MMADYDCLLIGHNELDFEQYFGILDNMAASGGRDHVAFTDLQLNHVKYNGKPYQALDLLTTLYNENRPSELRKEFYNGDCLWTAIAYLGSYLAHRGYSFDFINLFHWEQEALRHKLQANRYQLIVLTGTMYVFQQNIWEVVTFIRRYCPDARIVAGGPYISKLAEEQEPEYMKPLFRYLNADFYCYVREGEQTLVSLLDAVKNNKPVSAIPNLSYRDGKNYVITPKRRETNPLADNMIDYPLFADAYRKSGWANVRISDGCPFACGFCAFPEHGNEHYTLMSLDRIERELDSIRAAGSISHIFFIDATLNVPRRQFKEMLRMMIRKQYGFRWHCFFRCDRTDEETIWLMREAGCIGVFLGLESANATVLQNMDKTAHQKDFRRALPWLKQAGIRQMVSVLVGFPGETIGTFRETLDFVEEIQPDFTRIQTWYCDPTTPVWFKRDKFGLRGKGYSWIHDTMDSETAVELVVDAFMSLRGVTWVPDPGYNWVALYAMEKLGMPISRQQAFLRLFGTAAKQELLGRKTAESQQRLIDGLRACSRFDEPFTADPAEAGELSGENYVAARSFWVDEFRGAVSVAAAGQAAGSRADRDTGSTLRPGWRHVLRQAVGSEGAAWPAILAAYRWALSQTIGADGAILVGLPGGESFPMRLAAPAGSGFESYRRDTQDLIERSRRHHQFAWFVLAHPLTAKEFGVLAPELRAAFLLADPQELAGRWPHDQDEDCPAGPVLTVDDHDRSAVCIELSYLPERSGDSTITAVGQRMLAALREKPQPSDSGAGERRDDAIPAASR